MDTSLTELRSRLNSLLPTLYRLRYDPNQKVQDSIRHLWLLLVDDERTSVNKAFPAIARDLIYSGMCHRQYRVRTSALLALSDLLTGGRTFEDVGVFLESLWRHLFRCMDDINEHVKAAAIQLSSTLYSLTCRLCDPVQSLVSEVRGTLKAVLEPLLNEGLLNRLPAVQGLCMRTILRIVSINQGSDALLPFIGKLLATLIETTSQLEPEAFSYLQSHAKSLDLTDEQMEQARLNFQRNSPVTDAIDQCTRLVRPSNLSDVVGRLSDIMRRGTGLGTLNSAVRCVSMLLGDHALSSAWNSIAPTSSENPDSSPSSSLSGTSGGQVPALILIKAAEHGLADSSVSLRKANANLLGLLCKVAKPKRGISLLYFQSSDF
jgi:proteasome component ECM29